MLTGQAPRVGRNCQASGYYTSTLEFRLLKSTEVALPPQPSTTAQAPDVEERKPEVPSTEVGEPKLPSAPSAQPPATAQTRRIDAPKPEVQSSEVGEPKQASNSPVHPSLTTQVPIPAQDFADRNSLAPVIIALNVVLPFLSIGILIWLLKSAQ